MVRLIGGKRAVNNPVDRTLDSANLTPVRQRCYPGFFLLVLSLTTVLWWLRLAHGEVAAQENTPGWTTPVNLSEVADMSSGSPTLLCDGYENLHLLWVEQDDTHADIYYSRQSEMGWSVPNSILALDEITFIDAVISAQDIVHVVAFTADGRLLHSFSLIHEAGNAHNWPVPSILADGIGPLRNFYAGGGALAIDQFGRLHILYSTADDPLNMSHTLFHISSTDEGLSWSPPAAVFATTAEVPVTFFGALQVDGRGRLHVVWEVRSHEYGVYSQLGYIRSEDYGQSWDPPVQLAVSEESPGVAMPAVLVVGDDEVHLTWDTPERLHRWSGDGGNTWTEPGLIMPGGAAFGGFNRLALDSAGTLHVVSAEGGGVFHAVWDGMAWTEHETIDDRDFDPHFQQLEVCQGNRISVVYTDHLGANGLWYSSKVAAAPARSPLPTPVSTPSLAPMLGAAAVTPDRTPVLTEANMNDDLHPVASLSVSEPGIRLQILAPVLPSMLVILVAVLFVRLHRK